MKPYRDIDGDSGIAAYDDSNPDSMIILFDNNDTLYEYHIDAIGSQNLDIMRQLAQADDGLHQFIQSNESVKNGSQKLKLRRK